jgi:hypothetical protein
MKLTTLGKTLMQPELISENEGRLMGAARELAHRLHLPTTFVKFLIVGGIGFLVNQFFLFLFYDSPAFWFFPLSTVISTLVVHKRGFPAAHLIDHCR